jgi:hypothetical protein
LNGTDDEYFALFISNQTPETWPRVDERDVCGQFGYVVDGPWIRGKRVFEARMKKKKEGGE